MVHFTPTPTTAVKQPLQTGATPDFFNGIALEKTFRRLAGTQASESGYGRLQLRSILRRIGEGAASAIVGLVRRHVSGRTARALTTKGGSSHGELQGYIIRQPRV